MIGEKLLRCICRFLALNDKHRLVRMCSQLVQVLTGIRLRKAFELPLAETYGVSHNVQEAGFLSSPDWNLKT